jgi:hypothetical protein
MRGFCGSGALRVMSWIATSSSSSLTISSRSDAATPARRA